jgi:dolichol-phosphate mannosyltransferase
VKDYSKVKVAVVVPTFNEAENLPPFVSALLSLQLDLKVLIVDDHSPDGTGSIADRLMRSKPDRMDVMHRPGKSGFASAYLEGFRRVLNNGAEAVVQIDADFSHDPAVLPDMVKQIEKADLVIGSRYIPGGSVDIHWPAWRKGLSAFGNFYSRTILGIPIRDVTTGYRVWRREPLLRMPLERVRSSGYVFQVEMAYLAYCLGYTIVESPIYFSDRKHGKSKLTTRIQAEAALRVWQIWWGYRDLRKARNIAGRPPI